MFVKQSLRGLDAEIQGPVQPGAAPLNPPSFWSGLLPGIVTVVQTKAQAELERIKQRGISVGGTKYQVPGLTAAQRASYMQPASMSSSLPWIIGGVGLIGIAAAVILMKKK